MYFIFFINNFITIYGNYNPANKILLISSIVFFHLIPFIHLMYLYNANKKNKINLINTVSIFILLFICIYFFNFDPNVKLNDVLHAGGGFFYKISNLFFSSNYFFYLICLISFFIIYKIFLINKINHFILFLILFLQIPHTYYFHEYYEPLFLILFFTLFDKSISRKIFLNINNIYFLYLFYLMFYISTFVKNYQLDKYVY